MCFSKGRFFLFQPYLQPYYVLAMGKALTLFEVHIPQNTLMILISKVAQKWPYGQGGSTFRAPKTTRVFT